MVEVESMYQSYYLMINTYIHDTKLIMYDHNLARAQPSPAQPSPAQPHPLVMFVGGAEPLTWNWGGFVMMSTQS